VTVEHTLAYERIVVEILMTVALSRSVDCRLALGVIEEPSEVDIASAVAELGVV